MQSFKRHDQSKLPNPTANAKAEEIVRLLDSACPVYSKNLIGHTFALIATKKLQQPRPDPKAVEFFQTLIDRDWTKLQSYQEWEPLSDNVEVYLIRCDANKGAVVTLDEPFELLLGGGKLMSREMLEGKEWQKASSLVPNDSWRTFPK